ncbi:MAG TPA: hypothetical protein VGR14_18985, partial [Verrucomicrobiae bacterium]|nr:hypothetical protein [Verrucomicrobiae bacterium]
LLLLLSVALERELLVHSREAAPGVIALADKAIQALSSGYYAAHEEWRQERIAAGLIQKPKGDLPQGRMPRGNN